MAAACSAVPTSLAGGDGCLGRDSAVGYVMAGAVLGIGVGISPSAPPWIFFSPARGQRFAGRDFFSFPRTVFLAAKENGQRSGTSQNS